MKISAFHLMPHRELPAGLRAALRVGLGHPALVGARRRPPGGPVLQLDARRAAARRPRPASTASAPTSITRTRTASCRAPTSWAARSPSSPRGWTSPSSRWDRRSPRRTRRSASPRSTGCSTASAGGGSSPGLPLGSPMDVNLCYGITPMEQRERYREAFALMLKAWQAREIFAWNGRYYQLANVNLWPRPIQTPHPPIWVPGSGSVSTFDFAVEHDVCYCFLSYSGARPAKTLMDGYWEVVARQGKRSQPVSRGIPPAGRGLGDGRAAPRQSTRGTSSTSTTSVCTSPARGSRRRATRTTGVSSSAARNPMRRTEDPEGRSATGTSSSAATSSPAAGHRASAARGGGREGAPRGEPDAAGADRLHAPRADPEEHLPPRPRSPAPPPWPLGGRGLGESLVARAAARDHDAPAVAVATAR